MKKRVFAWTAAALLMVAAFTSCDFIKSAYQLKNCEYTYHSIGDIKVAGLDFSSGVGGFLQMSNITKIANLIAGNFSELPLEMTVNVNVKNPGTVAAGINNVKYDLAIDNINGARSDYNHACQYQDRPVKPFERTEPFAGYRYCQEFCRHYRPRVNYQAET